MHDMTAVAIACRARQLLSTGPQEVNVAVLNGERIGKRLVNVCEQLRHGFRDRGVVSAQPNDGFYPYSQGMYALFRAAWPHCSLVKPHCGTIMPTCRRWVRSPQAEPGSMCIALEGEA